MAISEEEGGFREKLLSFYIKISGKHLQKKITFTEDVDRDITQIPPIKEKHLEVV